MGATGFGKIKRIKMMVLKLFLRFAIAFSFLSAVADRFGFWNKEIAVWGNWENFISYTKLINPWLPEVTVSFIGLLATILEILFAICLIVGFKTEFFAKLSGYLLLLFAFSMTFSTGIKGAFDYSVFSASAASFALSTMHTFKYLEIDILLNSKK